MPTPSRWPSASCPVTGCRRRSRILRRFAISSGTSSTWTAAQNVATFCTTYDDGDVRYLMDRSVNKNLIDKDEYPQSAEVETRCVSMLAALWNAPRATLYDLSDRLRI